MSGWSADHDLTTIAAPTSLGFNLRGHRRRKAAAFAAEQGADQALVADINLAVSEAATNAVNYGDESGSQGSVGLLAQLSGGWLEFSVTDEGERFGKGSADGLGLAIIARLCDDLKIIQEGAGTTVLMRFALR